MSAGSILEMRAAGEAGAVSEGLKAPSRNFRRLPGALWHVSQSPFLS